MRVYQYRADGLALGSQVVVIASDATTAKRLASKWCKENSVNADTLALEDSWPLIAPAVVYGWNGDY